MSVGIKPDNAFMLAQKELAMAKIEAELAKALNKMDQDVFGGAAPDSGHDMKLTSVEVKKAVAQLKQHDIYKSFTYGPNDPAWNFSNYKIGGVTPKKPAVLNTGGPFDPEEIKKLLRCIPDLCRISVTSDALRMAYVIRHTTPAHERTYKVEAEKKNFWASIDDPRVEREHSEPKIVVEKFPEWNQEISIDWEMLSRVESVESVDGFRHHLIEKLGHQIEKEKKYHA